MAHVLAYATAVVAGRRSVNAMDSYDDLVAALSHDVYVGREVTWTAAWNSGTSRRTHVDRAYSRRPSMREGRTCRLRAILQ
eukprot:4020829-Pleurochrysis_carterae.AAC.2